MTLKTLSTILTDKTLAAPVLEAAAAMARRHDAHLDVLCLGVDRSQMGYYYAGANALILQEAITRAGEEAEELEAEAQRVLSRTEATWGTDTGVCQLTDLSRHVALHARFSDLGILPKPYGKSRGVEMEPLTEAAMFGGRAAALVLPDGADLSAAPKRALLCWNESIEALSAIRAALPLLREAGSVQIVVIDPPVHGPGRSDPGGQLAAWLSRHGIRPDIDVLARTMPRVSDVIRRHAADTAADLIVMGAYGHSRFRESILGGATRDMLEETGVPVLMAH